MAIRLTDEQRQIVQSKASKKLVVAGPGSGKTTLLLAVAKRKKSKRTLLLTFSKRTVEEIQSKLGTTDSIDVMTLHAFGNRLIRAHYRELGYSTAAEYVADAKAQKLYSDHVREELKQWNITAKEAQKLSKLLMKSIKSNGTLSVTLPSEYLHYEDRLNALKQKLGKTKRRLGIATFSDQLLGGRWLLKNSRKAQSALKDRYDTLLVDEFQDLNSVQLEMVRELATLIPNVLVVGDDAQSIYGFRGAIAGGFNEFKQWFPRAKSFSLTLSHRCSQKVLAVANHLRSRIDDLEPMRFTSAKKGIPPFFVACESLQGQDQRLVYLIKQVNSRRGVRFSNITVLARSYSNLSEAFKALSSANIPCFLGNQKALDDTCEKVKLLLRVIDGDYSEVISLLEALDIEASYDNQQSVRSLISSSEIQLAYLLKTIAKARNIQSIENRLRIIEKCLVYYVGKHGKKVLWPYINQLLALVKESKTIAEAYGLIDDYRARNAEGVALQTIHSAKGLEYDAVFIVDLVDGWFPHERTLTKFKAGSADALQDELKLLYVGVTRARKWLCLMSPPNPIFVFDSLNGAKQTKKRKVMKDCALIDTDLMEHFVRKLQK